VPPWWGQAQSHIADLDGRPLVAGNWEGPSRPYVLGQERLEPLVADEVDLPRDLDLLSPQPLSARRVVLAGTRHGRPDHDLYLYDEGTRTLTNLTRTPGRDDGEVCIAPGGTMLAYRAERRGVVAQVTETGLRPIGGDPLPGLYRCLFVDAETLLGVEWTPDGPRLHRCALGGTGGVRCAARGTLDGLEAFVSFVSLPNGPGLIARRRGEPWRRSWRLSPALDGVQPAPIPTGVQGDVLDHDGARLRVGYQSRYHVTGVEDAAVVVQTVRRVGSAYVGIVATPSTGRTLARLRRDQWTPIRHPRSADPPSPPPIRELWLEGTGGARYQAFRFGAADARRIVVWWHGGPHENVSPRFNPYFHRLHELGFAVLAVNYPGSTGRGAAYERAYRRPDVRDCIDAVWHHLAAVQPTHVVSWSVSVGITPQLLLLERGHPLSGVVDQAGWKRTTIVAVTGARDLPLFTIRGRYDPDTPVERVSFWYDGGHDLQRGEDFVALFAQLEPFLAALPAVRWPAAGGSGPSDERSAAE